MITIDALYLFLLIELACILAAGAIFFFIRAGKYRKLYLGGLKELSAVKQAQEGLRKQPVALKSEVAIKPAPPAAVVQNAKTAATPNGQMEDIKKQLLAAETALKDKTEQLAELQVKFTDLEKEYMILYHQQQKQQQG
jgi:hypothetical protein